MCAAEESVVGAGRNQSRGLEPTRHPFGTLARAAALALLLERGGPKTASQIADVLGASPRAINDMLRILGSARVVRPCGVARRTDPGAQPLLWTIEARS